MAAEDLGRHLLQEVHEEDLDVVGHHARESIWQQADISSFFALCKPRHHAEKAGSVSSQSII